MWMSSLSLFDRVGFGADLTGVSSEDRKVASRGEASDDSGCGGAVCTVTSGVSEPRSGLTEEVWDTGKAVAAETLSSSLSTNFFVAAGVATKVLSCSLGESRISWPDFRENVNQSVKLPIMVRRMTAIVEVGDEYCHEGADLMGGA